MDKMKDGLEGVCLYGCGIFQIIIVVYFGLQIGVFFRCFPDD